MSWGVAEAAASMLLPACDGVVVAHVSSQTGQRWPVCDDMPCPDRSST
jgi:hypothetical protein